MTERDTPRWVTVEGRNGVGKTHLVSTARALLGTECVAVAELPDAHPDSLPGQVIAALAAGGDLFLRGGAPFTETLLLAALQVHRYETVAPSAKGRLVLEDRGPLTVAVYQAAILEPDHDTAALAAARQILATITTWRPLPHATVLLRDDPQECVHRFARRIGRAVRPDEARLMSRAGELYDRLAGEVPGLIVLDRRDATDTAIAHRIAQIGRAVLSTTEVRSVS